MEEGDRGGHGPKNNRSVIKDKENLTEITLIFLNIFERLPFSPPYSNLWIPKIIYRVYKELKSKVHPCTGTEALYRLYGP